MVQILAIPPRRQGDSQNSVEHSLEDAEHAGALLVTPLPKPSESRRSLKRGAVSLGLLEYGFTKKRIVADDDDEQADDEVDTAPAVKVKVLKAKISNAKVPKAKVPKARVPKAKVPKAKVPKAKVKVKAKAKAIKIAPADRNLTLNKPEPFGQPLIWSDKRQALCETLSYYRAYEAGAYSIDKVVHGLLCDKGVYARDHIDDHVVICSV
jgi:pyruvate/2-oxoglutarate dehydrogenase complex dihydrolipoamide acyltransferase (E2) component